jgi:hypothetical protein
MKKQSLVKSGIFLGTADAMQGDVETAVTAAGTTQTDATQLTGDLSVVGTAAASTGVKLPPMEKGDTHYVHNLGANAVLVYPGQVGAVINALAANAGFSVAVGRGALLMKTGAANFVVMYGA